MSSFSIKKKTLILWAGVQQKHRLKKPAVGLSRSWVLRFEQPLGVNLPSVGAQTHGKTFFRDRARICGVFNKAVSGTYTLKVYDNGIDTQIEIKNTESYTELTEAYEIGLGHRITLYIVAASSVKELEVELILEPY